MKQGYWKHLSSLFNRLLARIMDLEPLFLMKNCIFRAFLALLGGLRAGQKGGSISFVFFIIHRYPREHLHFRVSNFTDFSPNDDRFASAGGFLKKLRYYPFIKNSAKSLVKGHF